MNELKQEYIGVDITITDSTNKTLIGLKGKIIDETKNTFKIKDKEIKGKDIQKKSYDRIKIKGER